MVLAKGIAAEFELGRRIMDNRGLLAEIPAFVEIGRLGQTAANAGEQIEGMGRGLDANHDSHLRGHRTMSDRFGTFQ
jgi:hypothetical protein